jgi:hypothetical protein
MINANCDAHCRQGRQSARSEDWIVAAADPDAVASIERGAAQGIPTAQPKPKPIKPNPPINKNPAIVSIMVRWRGNLSLQ